MNWNNGICAVRHIISVKTKPKLPVSSRTGRDMFLLSGFYPSLIPNGINAITISENYKELAI